MQLDHGRSGARRGVHLLVRIDEQRDGCRLPRAGPRFRATARGSPHIKASFGGDLGAVLRHQAAVGGPQPRGDLIIRA
jgi:hypothetical protein